MNDLVGGLEGIETNKKTDNKMSNKENKNNYNKIKNLNKNLFEGLTQNYGDANNENTIKNSQLTETENKNNNGNIDLLGNISGSSLQNENNFNNNANNFFDNLVSSNQINNNFSNNKYFTPLNIKTEKFGELWENSPEEDSFSININIGSPQKFHEIIKSKGNFAAIDIINNEAISAATFKNEFALVHATIEMNEISLLIKCQNKSYNNEVGNYIIGLFQ